MEPVGLSCNLLFLLRRFFKLVALAMAVAKGVTKDILYSSCSHSPVAAITAAGPSRLSNSVSELAALATATSVAKGALYFNARRGNEAIAQSFPFEHSPGFR